MTEYRGTPTFLRQIRVHNWHSIYSRTIDVPNTGLLVFGTNGSGKTSLQDAVQFALFPDAGRARFNAAVASSATDRNLLGYVLQKVDESADKRPVYLWRRRITYVALLFERGQSRQAFVVGIDGSDTGTTERVHATLPGVPDLSALPLMDERRQMLPLKDFERFVRSRKGHVHDSVGSYVQEVSRYLGSPHENWPQLMKSAIGFKEIKDATDFVRRFLDEQKIDHASLTRIVESYEALRKNAEDTEAWIRLLEGAVGPVRVDESGRQLRLDEQSALYRYRHFRSNAAKYEYAKAVIPRMRIERRLSQELLPEIAGLESRIERIEVQLKALEHGRRDTTAEYNRVDAQLRDLGIAQQIDSLEERIQSARADVERSKQATAGVSEYLGSLRALLGIVATPELLELSRGEESHLHTNDLLSGKGIHQLSEIASNPRSVDLRSARAIAMLTDDGETAFNKEMYRLESRQHALRNHLGELEEEQSSLRRGRPRYGPGVESARALLRDKLGWQDARPLCEMIEVPSEHDEWRLAVEAELGRDRESFVIPEELYERAMLLYEQYREKGYPNDQGKREPLFRVGLVDVGKIREKRANRVTEGSLATKVVSENEDAEDYVAFSLGRIHCERDIRRLREHYHAITPTLNYYRSFKLSSFEPHSTRLMVGTHARALRLARLEKDIEEVRGQMEAQNKIAAKIAQAHTIMRQANHSFATFRQDVSDARELAAREARLEELEAQMRRFRESEAHQGLIAERERIQVVLDQISEAERTANRERDKESGLLAGRKYLVDKARNDIQEEQQIEDAQLTKMPLEERLRAKRDFEVELHAQAEKAFEFNDEVLLSLLNTASRQAGEHRQRATNAQLDFGNIQANFQSATGFQIMASVEDPEPLLSEYRRLKDTALPEKREALAHKAQEMREGIIQGILNTLGSQFLATRRLVDEINRSMSNVETRMGRFKLDFKPKVEWLDIYELAQESMGMLFTEQLDADDPFMQKVERFMKRFLATDTDRGELSDYRNYLEFEVLNQPEGSKGWSIFRGTRQGSSGGERQVPFYVMTFALMDHVYRQGAHAKKCMGRLLLMDEVFHNMSDDNVSDVMSLARSLGLQILMVTPGKLRTLAPLFGKTVQVAKDRIHPSCPSRFIEFERQDLPEDLLNFEEYEESGAAA